jgi:hypothetical protein
VGRPSATTPDRPASWYRDPTGRYQYRFWDGWAWSGWVSTDDELGADLDTDPSPLDPPHQGRHRTSSASALAITSGLFAVVTSLTGLLAFNSIRDSASLALTLVLAYLCTTAIALAVAALWLGANSWVRNPRRDASNLPNACALITGSIGLAIALVAWTRM